MGSTGLRLNIAVYSSEIASAHFFHLGPPIVIKTIGRPTFISAFTKASHPSDRCVALFDTFDLNQMTKNSPPLNHDSHDLEGFLS